MESCRWCGRELRDVTEPSMGGDAPQRWVHDYGGGQLCWPDKQGSPRAAYDPDAGPYDPCYACEYVDEEPILCRRPAGTVLRYKDLLEYDRFCGKPLKHEGEHDDTLIVLRGTL